MIQVICLGHVCNGQTVLLLYTSDVAIKLELYYPQVWRKELLSFDDFFIDYMTQT